MLKSIITSETRIKLLLRFFLNPSSSAYLRQLAKEFGESTNSVRVELNKLSQAKILNAHYRGRNRVFEANRDHPLFEEIRNIVLKSTGIDKVLSNIIQKLGDISFAFVRGDYAVGKDSGLIDLVIVGNNINLQELERVRRKTESLISRKISILTLKDNEYAKLEKNFDQGEMLILFKGKRP